MWRRGLHAVEHKCPAGGGHDHSHDRRPEDNDAAQGAPRQETQGTGAQEGDHHAGYSLRSDDDVLSTGGSGSDPNSDAGGLQRGRQPQPVSS